MKGILWRDALGGDRAGIPVGGTAKETVPEKAAGGTSRSTALSS